MSVTTPAERLDLEQPRDIGKLLGDAFRLLNRHFLVFCTVTLVIYAPAGLLVTGIALRGFEDPSEVDVSVGLAALGAVLLSLVFPALITAAHVVLVQGLSRGEEPSIRAALAGALPRIWVLLAAALLYTGAVLLGLLALIVPGVWLAVRLYFAPQAVVVDDTDATGGLRASWELVRGHWWSTFGSLLLAGLLAGIPVQILDETALQLFDAGAIYVLVSVLLAAVGISYTALFGTLLFFTLRARRPQVSGSSDWTPPAAPGPGEDAQGGLGAPERPEGLPPRRDP